MAEHKLSFLVNRPDGSWVATCSCGHESAPCRFQYRATGAQKEHEEHPVASLPLDRETVS